MNNLKRYTISKIQGNNSYISISDWLTIALIWVDNLIKSIADVGKSFNSGIKSVQKVFGWFS